LKTANFMCPSYHYWQKIILKNPNPQTIEEKYNQGFVLTRLKNEMHQIKGLRVDLKNFQLSSENRRILRKTRDYIVSLEPLPLKEYDWRIHKVGAGFYQKRFGENIFSANKIKELIVDSKKSSFNCLAVAKDQKISQDIGWCISFKTKNIFHYAYPFYELKYFKNNLGISMMLKTLLLAKQSGIRYFYLGSVWDKRAKYKLQFSPQEFFDGQNWQDVKNLTFV